MDGVEKEGSRVEKACTRVKKECDRVKKQCSRVKKKCCRVEKKVRVEKNVLGLKKNVAPQEDPKSEQQGRFTFHNIMSCSSNLWRRGLSELHRLGHLCTFQCERSQRVK